MFDLNEREETIVRCVKKVRATEGSADAENRKPPEGIRMAMR